MDALVAFKRGEPGAELPALRTRRVRSSSTPKVELVDVPARSDVATDNPVPEPPFWGSRVVKGLRLPDVAKWLDERATFMGQWGLRGARGGDGPSYEELVETEGRPRLRMWLDRVQAEQIMEPAVVYGYWPCWSEGDSLIVLDPDDKATEIARFSFPRQHRDRFLCLADYFRPKESGEVDVIGLHLVTMGSRVSDVTAELFAKDAYRDYLELHGLSVQLTEALAEYWHARVRSELGISGGDARGADRHPQAGLHRRALLLRLSRLSRPRGAVHDGPAARAGADRGDPQRGAAAAPGAVDRRVDRAPPRGDVLQRPVTGRPVAEPSVGLPAAVLWDLDGTLADTEPSWFAAEYALAAEHGAEWTDADAHSLVGSDLIDSGVYIRDRMGLDLDPADIVELLLDRVVADTRRGVVWRPGARELLSACRAADLPCALVTMSYARVVEPVLDQLPAGTFGVVVTGDTVEHGKPHPEAYLRAAASLGADPRRCVAIEDSPTGASSAEDAGAHVLVVPHTVPVPDGPGRTSIPSLAGVGVGDLTALAARHTATPTP